MFLFFRDLLLCCIGRHDMICDFLYTLPKIDAGLVSFRVLFQFRR